MILTKRQQLINQYVDEILDLLNHFNEITTSDLQGIIYALVEKILLEKNHNLAIEDEDHKSE